MSLVERRKQDDHDHGELNSGSGIAIVAAHRHQLHLSLCCRCANCRRPWLLQLTLSAPSWHRPRQTFHIFHCCCCCCPYYLPSSEAITTAGLLNCQLPMFAVQLIVGLLFQLIVGLLFMCHQCPLLLMSFLIFLAKSVAAMGHCHSVSAVDQSLGRLSLVDGVMCMLSVSGASCSSLVDGASLLGCTCCLGALLS